MVKCLERDYGAEYGREVVSLGYPVTLQLSGK